MLAVWRLQHADIIYYLLLTLSFETLDLGLEIQNVGVDYLVQAIGKRSIHTYIYILCLDSTSS